MKTPRKQHAKNLGIPFKKYMFIYVRGWEEANEATSELCKYSSKLERAELARIKRRNK